MERHEEQALLRRVADGDRAAFGRLVKAHQRPLSAFARRLMQDHAAADDIVQETLLRLWTRAGRYDPAAARLTTWLHTIAHNLCVDSLRRRSHGVELELDSERHPEPGVAGPDHDEQTRRRGEQVQRALAALPERQRSALLLCHYQGLSNRDAAQVLEIGVEALESLLARGRRRLRRELEVDHES